MIDRTRMAETFRGFDEDELTAMIEVLTQLRDEKRAAPVAARVARSLERPPTAVEPDRLVATR